MEKKLNCGVYKITNVTNNKIYIGSAKDFDKRWKRHVSELNKQIHCNSILQNSWNKHGQDNFKFEIIEYVTEIENLLIREQFYIDFYQPFGEIGYNIATKTSGGDILSANPNRQEVINKISQTMKKKWNEKPEAEKEQIRKNMFGSTNPAWKNGGKYNICNCGKKIASVNKTCRKCINITKEYNPFYGKKHSDEYKKNSSENRKGKYLGSQNKPLIIDGVEYSSLGSASSALGISTVTIRNRILSKSEKFKNYKYKI